MAKDREVDVGTLVRVWIFWLLLPVLGGCANNEPRPTILYDYGAPVRSAKPRRWVLAPRPPVVPRYPAGWVPPAGIERRWRAIVIHHSDTDCGNAAIFDNEHKNRGWEGVGYDFVIGNGNGSGDGQVEVTIRWRQQKTGAHCKTPNNWANEEAVGICLVGKFEQHRYDALVSFVYNLGPASLNSIPGFETMGRAIRSGNIGKIGDAMLLYDNAGGRRLAGLTRRRHRERRLLKHGAYKEKS